MTLAEDAQPTKTPVVQTGFAGAALLLCAGLVIWIGVMVLREIDAFSAANSDNLQWSLSQSEVEFLQFRFSVQDAERDPATLPEMRRRFDIFFSRISTLRTGQLYESLRETQEFVEPGRRVQAFLDRTVPIVDGEDSALLAALPQIALDAQGLSQDVRALSLAALVAFAKVSDLRREGLNRLMIYMGALLLVLFLGLTLLAFTMNRLFRLARRRADELQAAGARMRTVIETSPNGIIVTDELGIIREFNTAAERIFGYSRAEVRGRVAREILIPSAEHERLYSSVFTFVAERRRPRPNERNFEIVGQTRTGRSFPAEVSVDRAEADNPLYVTFVRDITQRKLSEAELTEARDLALAGERAKSEFLAVMSHEMRTPLNGLLGTMQLMRDQSLTERQTTLLDQMQSSGKLLLDLVNDVLDLAKFESGKMKAETEPFSVTRLMDGLVQTAQPLAESFGNELSWGWNGEAGNDVVMGDARRLRQVLLNLVGNALKFTRDGTVEVELEYMDEARTELEFRVVDSGIGIAEEDLARIFNDFETLDSSYARETSGTGLGLGIARRFVRLMGGEIGAESVHGEGSVFWIRLPLVPAEGVTLPEEEDQKALPAPARALDVLVVEDNEINRFIVREMLQSEGHKVTEAENGKLGVERAAEHRYDLILMDISMPVMDGTAAAAAIRGGDGPCADVPIIALTAHALPEERARFRDVGMELCLTKPIERPLLLRTISEAVGAAPAPEPAASAKPAGPALVNEDVLDSFFGDLPAEMTGRLMARFFTEMDRDVAILSEMATDDPELRPLVHKCAGSCGTFGLAALRGELARIETVIKQGAHPSTAELAALPALWTRSRKALESRLQDA